jgi:hypothetical protein
MQIDIRKIALGVEEVHHDGGPPLAKPILKAWAGVVVRNRSAWTYRSACWQPWVAIALA